MKEIDLYSVYLIRTNQKFNFPKKIIKEKSNCFIYELKDENVFLKDSEKKNMNSYRRKCNNKINPYKNTPKTIFSFIYNNSNFFN